jgi:hypothetical protein
LNETVANAMGNLPAGTSAKDYTDQRFNSMQNTVNQVAKNAYAGVAAAMAMQNMTPSEPGNTVVAAGAGMYQNGSAVGVGATYCSRNSNWLGTALCRLARRATQAFALKSATSSNRPGEAGAERSRGARAPEAQSPACWKQQAGLFYRRSELSQRKF